MNRFNLTHPPPPSSTKHEIKEGGEEHTEKEEGEKGRKSRVSLFLAVKGLKWTLPPTRHPAPGREGKG